MERVWSPRAGVNVKLSDDGKTILRATYGRAYRQILLNEIDVVHPGIADLTQRNFSAATGGYTTLVSVTNSSSNLKIDPDLSAPKSDTYLDRHRSTAGRAARRERELRAQGREQHHRLAGHRRHLRPEHDGAAGRPTLTASRSSILPAPACSSARTGPIIPIPTTRSWRASSSACPTGGRDR